MCKIPLDKCKIARKSRCILVFGVKLMKTSVLYLEIVRYIHYIIFSDYYIRRATKRQMDFTRNRKMSFTDYIFAIIKGTKTSLQSSIDTFFESQHKNHVEYSKQAFSKGRQRIKPEAFQELFLAVAERFYQKAETNTWRGYHLFGIDGYATMFLANLAGVLEFDLHEEIEAAHNSPEHKYQYKLNKNRTISELKRTVVEMIVTRSKVKRMKLFLEIKNRLHDAVVPVRPNRTAPRTKRHKSAKFSQNIKRP